MTFRPVADRDPYSGLVGVYKNLNSRDPKTQWSVRALSGPHKGLKVAEGESVTLTDCGAYVRESTRQRMIAGSRDNAAKASRGHREVHAWITGYLADNDPEELGRRVTYHPFESGEFFHADNGQPFTRAESVTFARDGNSYAT
jgi:hypothetical protein